MITPDECRLSGGHHQDNQGCCHTCGVEVDEMGGEVLALPIVNHRGEVEACRAVRMEQLGVVVPTKVLPFGTLEVQTMSGNAYVSSGHRFDEGLWHTLNEAWFEAWWNAVMGEPSDPESLVVEYNLEGSGLEEIEAFVTWAERRAFAEGTCTLLVGSHHKRAVERLMKAKKRGIK